MQDHDLPSPDIGGKGFHLRRVAAQAISQQEISAVSYGGGQHPSAQTLAKFFAACSDAAYADGLITPILGATPQFLSKANGSGAAAGATIDKGGSAATAAFSSSNVGVATVNASTGFVTPVGVGTCRIIVTLPMTATYRAGTFSYPFTVT